MKTTKKTVVKKNKSSNNRTKTGALCTKNKASDSRLPASGKRRTSVATSATRVVGRSTDGATSAITGRTGTITTEEYRLQNEEFRLQNASMEKQIAVLQEQIAMLQEASGFRSQASGFASNINPEVPSMKPDALSNPEVRSLKSEARIGPNPLPAPTLVIMSVSSNSILVDWDKVTNATGYLIEVAKNDSTFTNPVTLNADAAATSLAIDGLLPNTTYYIRVMATGTGSNANSAFSNVQSIKTLNDGPGGMGDGITGNLQTWLDNLQTEFQNVALLVPELDNTELNSTDRMRLNGSGVRRYGFIEKTADVAGEFPQFWPAIVDDTGKLKELVGEIEVLRNLLVWFRYAARVVQDLLLLAGDDAFRLAGSYYTAARDGARRKNPEAQQVFDMLRLYWRRRRSTTEEPTEHEMLRDAKALLRGRKDGTITIENESDSVIKGKKVLVDNTFSKPRGGVKVVESAEVE